MNMMLFWLSEEGASYFFAIVCNQHLHKIALAVFQQHLTSDPQASSKHVQMTVRLPDVSHCSVQQSLALLSLLMLMHGSGSASLDDSMDGAPSISSPERALNLFCTCKSSDGAGAFLLVPEITSFQPFASTRIFISQHDMQTLPAPPFGTLTS